MITKDHDIIAAEVQRFLTDSRRTNSDDELAITHYSGAFRVTIKRDVEVLFDSRSRHGKDTPHRPVLTSRGADIDKVPTHEVP